MLLAPKKRQSKRKRKQPRAHWALFEKCVHGHNIPLGLTPDKRADWIANALLDITRQIEDHGLKLSWRDLPSRIAGAKHDEIGDAVWSLYQAKLLIVPAAFVHPDRRHEKDKWVYFQLSRQQSGKRRIKRVFYKGELLSAGELANRPENTLPIDRQTLTKRIFTNNYSAHMALSEPKNEARSHPKTRNQKKAPIGCELNPDTPETPAN